jgi:UDP-glucose 4-epimerase
MKSILVTGGSGFIGSHTVVELQKAGYNAIIADNLSNSERHIVERISRITGIVPEFIEADCTNRLTLVNIFKTHPDIVAVAHFAAFKAVAESIQKPLKYYQNNLFSMVALLEAMGECHVGNLVFSSSCTVYGEAAPSPVNERMPMLPTTSPYGRTKQMCEEMITDYSRTNSNFRCISLRYFNPIGAHPSGQIGELPLGVPNNLIPYITQSAAGVRGELKVFGNDYPTPDGTAIRDYIDVVDLAKAHVLSINRLIDANTTENVEAFNLGIGQGASVLEVIKTFEEVNSLKLKWSFAPKRDGDVPMVYGDTSKANRVLGWRAETSLAQSLRNAWLWETNLRNGK